MPRSIQVIVAPRPRDPRVLLLAKTLGATRADAYVAVCETWEALATEADDDGIVPGWTVEMIDAQVDTLEAGCGRAMVEVGLVGVVGDGLVLPAELRQRDERRRRPAVDDDVDDAGQRTRRANRQRQRRHRALKKVSPPAVEKSIQVSPPPSAAPRTLGEVDGYRLLVCYRRGDGVPFYKLVGATPEEWTGTVTDPANPSFAEGLEQILATMRRKGGGLDGPTTMRPSPAAVVAAAERYRQERDTAAADATRHDEANRAFAEAAGDDLDDADQEPAERDRHAPVTPVTRDTVTVTLLSRPEGATGAANSSGAGDLQGVTCHAPVTPPALSSSSSSCTEMEIEKTTTTTRPVTPAERDREGAILDRLLEAHRPAPPPPPAPPRVQEWQANDLDARRQRWAEVCGRALGISAGDFLEAWRADRDGATRRLRAAGVDPREVMERVTRSPLEAAGVSVPDLRHDRPVIVRPPPDAGPDDPPDDHGDAVADHADDPGDVPAGLEARAAS